MGLLTYAEVALRYSTFGLRYSGSLRACALASNPYRSAIFFAFFTIIVSSPCKKQATAWKMNFPAGTFSFYSYFFANQQKWDCSLMQRLPSYSRKSPCGRRGVLAASAAHLTVSVDFPETTLSGIPRLDAPRLRVSCLRVR